MNGRVFIAHEVSAGKNNEMPDSKGMPTEPTFDWEASLFAHSDYQFILGFDEVGRGAIAGPVVVACSLLTRQRLTEPIPEGLRDSKLISEKKRPIVLEAVTAAFPVYALGEADAAYIDTHGIVPSLMHAAQAAHKDALEAAGSILPAEEIPTRANTLLLLDGSHNWLSEALPEWDSLTRVKGDRDCVSMAAASLIAKVHRDSYMQELATLPEYAHYGWEKNKGYGAATHYAAIEEHGVTDHHRKTWLKGK